MRKRKRWSEMTTEELAAATREFDDPSFDPPACEPPLVYVESLRRVQKKAARDVAGPESAFTAVIRTPRLADRRQAGHFRKRIVDLDGDAQ